MGASAAPVKFVVVSWPCVRWELQRHDLLVSAGPLVALQARILTATARIVRSGGRLVYSVCTLTAAESIDHRVPDGFEIDDGELPAGTWRRYGHGWQVLPHDADTDGMVVIRYRRCA